MRSSSGLERSIRGLMGSLCLVWMSGCAHVQPTQSWSELVRRLDAGRPVAVTDDHGAEVRGRVAEITAGLLALDVDGARRQFVATSVVRVRRDGDPLWNGLAIGAGIGALAAALPDNRCAGTPSGCDDKQIPQRLTALAAITAAGVAIDAMHRDRSVLYQSPGRTAVGVVPILMPEGAGVAISLRLAALRASARR